MTHPQDARAKYESQFWDQQVAQGKRRFRRNWYTEANLRLWDKMMRLAGDLRGKRVLFVGCGEASAAAVEMARRGADVWCVDISPASISHVMRHAVGPLEGRIHGVVADAEHLPFEPGSFQVAVGKAILHHLDLRAFLSELRRVCAPGAVFVFSEPLGFNPLINLFRRLTPAYRVPTERPFRARDLRLIRVQAPGLKEVYTYFLSIGAFPFFFVGWSRLGRWMLKALSAADSALFALVPPARWLAWNVTLAGVL